MGPRTLAVEIVAGARVQSSVEQRFGLRLGAKGVLVPGWLDRRVGVGLGVTAGPALAVGGASSSAPAAKQSVNDLAFELVGRGRRRLGPSWLELDVGPSVHVVSAEVGTSHAHHADLALDALVGIVVPWGRYFVGARAGGFYVLASSTAGGVGAADLPRGNGEAALCAGVVF